MSVAALVLSIVATVLALAALTWHVVEHNRRGPRPQLTPLVGLATPDGLLSFDAGGPDVRDALAHAARTQPRSPLIVGVRVVNAGRAPLQVASWALRADPAGTT